MATKKNTVSVGDWIITFIILAIPLVNIIMLLIWAFGDGGNLNKKNFAKAALIMFVISILFYVVTFATIGPSLMKLVNNIQGL